MTKSIARYQSAQRVLTQRSNQLSSALADYVMSAVVADLINQGFEFTDLELSEALSLGKGWVKFARAARKAEADAKKAAKKLVAEDLKLF